MYSKLLKHLGLLGILFMLIQLMKFGMYIVSNGYGLVYNVSEIRLNSILIVVVAYLSYLWCILKEKVIDGQKLHIIIGGLLVGLGRCMTLMVPIYYIVKQYMMQADIWFGVILIGLIIFAYVLMYIDYRRDYDRIINLEIYVFFVVVAIAINAYSSNSLSLIGLGFITVIGALSRNQANIDYLLERTQKNTPMVTGLRKSNIKWVLLLTLFLLVAYDLRNVVASGIEIIWRGIIYILSVIIGFLFRPNEEIPLEVGSAEVGGAIGMPVAEGSSAWYKIICAIIVAAIIIWKHEEIWLFIKSVFKGCIRRIQLLFRWLNAALFHVKKREIDITPYYTEQIEEISDLTKVIQHKKPKLSKRKIMHQVQEANKIQDANLQYRKKYKILIETLIWREIPILKSHTPRQIYEQALKSDLQLDLEKETKGYENVKYGELAVDEDAQKAINTHLNQMLGSKG